MSPIAPRPGWPLSARWLLSALAFPPAGLIATRAVTAVDRPLAAMVAGAIAGAGIGTGQWLALRTAEHRVGLRAGWIVATSVAMAGGLTAGAALVDYGTATHDLLVMGLVTGTALGPAQAMVLRASGLATTARAAAWAVVVPALWALGWFVTASVGVDVERQYAVFGLTGALASSALGGLALTVLIDRPAHT